MMNNMPNMMNMPNMPNMLNMPNMPNMLNMMGQMPQMPQVMTFDPTKCDTRFKKTMMNQTIAQTKIGMYKNLPKFKPLTSSYYQDYNPGPPTNICEVSVVFEHVIDAAEPYAEKGLNYNSGNNMNPVVLNVVGNEFMGTNLESSENVRDELINIRTTFNNTIGTNSVFPMKEDECVYSKIVTVIRPKYPMSFLPYPQTYRFGLITAAPIKVEDLLSENRMKANDYVRTCTILECVFQTAISTRHMTLVLPPFGHEDDGNPVDDIIKIYNYCILKYGHMFQKIIIGVPPYYPKGIFEAYKQGIINPMELVASVDKKYEQELLKKNLMEISTTKNATKNSIKKKKDKNTDGSFSKEQMEMFMKIMQSSS